MRVHDLKDEEGRVYAFEVGNFMLGRRGVLRIVRRIPSAQLVAFHRRREHFCEFDVHGFRFVVWEPWNDNSRYWIGPQPRSAEAPLGTVRAAFERARLVMGLLFH